MQFHPRLGAESYDRHLFGTSALRPGWNVVHRPPDAPGPPRYIFIGKGEGLNTLIKPDVPEADIHPVFEADTPPFEGSAAWTQMQKLASPATRDMLSVIALAAAEPLRGPTPSVDKRIERDLKRIKQAIAAGGPAGAVIQPLHDVMRDALDFRLTMTHASNILGFLLAKILQLPSPLDETSFLDRLSLSVDHLVDRALALKEDRQTMKLTPFYQATFLAMVLGNTALLLCKEAAPQLPADSKERRSFERRGLYIDEVMAHDLSPCLLHPIDFAPLGLVEYQHATAFGIVDVGGMYSGAEGQGTGAVDVPTMWPRIEAYAAKARDVDITASIVGDNNPLHAKDMQRLQMFLLTMQLGGAR